VFILLAAKLAVSSTSSKCTNILKITKKTFLKRRKLLTTNFSLMILKVFKKRAFIGFVY
jgi:hypothetical protein